MARITILAIASLVSILSVACHKEAINSKGESDTGTDLDTDSDTDVDSDTDMDTDMDSDSDTDTETDIDSDTNTDADTETGIVDGGQLLWAKRAGGDSLTGEEVGYSISALSDGSALVTGCYNHEATFGLGETNETMLSLGDSLSNNIFVAKYNADGTLAWANHAGGSYNDCGQCISAFTDGSALIAGYFYGEATFGLGEANETMLNSEGSSDIHVAKYNADGTLAWAKRAGGSNNDYGFGISIQSSGSALVAGNFSDTATFGLGETNETVLDSDGEMDIFVAKYNANGNLAWVKHAGQAVGDQNMNVDISALSDGSALVTGYFGGTATFGPSEIGETVLISDGDWYNIFVAKFGP